MHNELLCEISISEKLTPLSTLLVASLIVSLAICVELLGGVESLRTNQLFEV